MHEALNFPIVKIKALGLSYMHYIVILVVCLVCLLVIPFLPVCVHVCMHTCTAKCCWVNISVVLVNSFLHPLAIKNMKVQCFSMDRAQSTPAIAPQTHMQPFLPTEWLVSSNQPNVIVQLGKHQS